MKLFLAIWVAILAVFDGVIATQLYRQVDAGRRFVAVRATIDESDVESRSDSDGTTYSPRVLYRYEIDGRRHFGDRVSFAEWGTSSYTRAARVVAEYPAGAEVQAFVDPDDPERAVLRKDLTGFPFAVILFLVPFHCVAVGLWMVARQSARRSFEAGLLAAVVAHDDGTTAVLRPAAMAPALVFVIALGGGSFLAVFAVILAFGFEASPGVVFGAIGGLVGVGALASAWWRRRVRAPERLAVIDGVRRRIFVGGLPPGAEANLLRETAGEEIRFDEVSAIEVESHGAGEVNGRPWQRHDLMLRRIAGDPIRVTFLRGRPGAAEPIVRWLRDRLGIAAPDGPP